MTREIIRTFTNISVNLPTRPKGRENIVDENILFDYYILLLLIVSNQYMKGDLLANIFIFKKNDTENILYSIFPS